MSDSNEARTEVAKLGEFGLINHLTERFCLSHPSSVLGVGDDAAVIKHDEKNKTIITTDLLLEGIHFDLMYVPLKHLGYKAVVVNLSDVYAMNATPRQILVSIGISNRFSVEALNELYEGIRFACEFYGVDLIGGDTSTSLKGLVISVTAIGEAPEEDLTYRRGARPGDKICVSGNLGAAYLGLQLLEREKQVFLEHPEVQPDLENRQYIVGRHIKPEARKDIFELLKKLEIKPTSMIDVSDGLSSEVLHLTTSSGVGARVYEEHIPIHRETYEMSLKFKIDATTCALNGGEDYELLFTINPEDEAKITEEMDIKVVGEITEKQEGVKLITKAGNEHPLLAQGWNAFGS